LKEVNSKPVQNKIICSRCGGNIFLDSDQYGWFEHCLRCGHTRDLPSVEVKSNAAANPVRSLSRDAK
jgi:hypothetical protein